MEQQPQQPVTPQPIAPATAGMPQTQTQPPAPQPAPAPTSPATPLSGVQKPAVGTPPSVAPDQGSKNKKLLIGCCSAAGCSVLLFILLIFIFLGFGGSTDNPIFAQFGVSGGEVVNILILLVNLVFGVFTFITFVIGVIGIFKVATTKKIDKDNRKKGAFMAFIAFGIMFLMIFLWIFAYLFLESKRTAPIEESILTVPTETVGLTSPITIKFDASQVPINKNRYEVLTYLWNFDDGEEATGLTQTHTYRSKGKNAGRYQVTLTITARDTVTGQEVDQEFTKIVVISNEGAHAVINAAPEKGEAPLEVSFDASQSVDPDGEIQEFAWDFDNDGTFDTTGEKAKYTFEQIGTFTVVLRMTESSGAYALAEQEIEVTESNEPIIVISVEGVEEDMLTKGVDYTFSGAESKSPLGRIESFSWNFGDDTPKKTTRTTSHTFETTGTYEVVLAVRDNTGRTGEGSRVFKVTNPESIPTPVITTEPAAQDGALKGQAPLRVSFDASNSADSDNNIIEYKWDFDNDNKTDATDAQATYTYDAAGTYTAALTVVDAAGNEEKTTVTITVESPGLQANLSADVVDGEVPLTVSFDASGSSYPEHRITAYEWDFGDGSEERLDVAKIAHQYTRVGAFTVTLRVVGDDGQKTEDTVLIHVRPISIRACFEPTPATGASPLEMLFNPACSTGTISNYKWDFGALGTSRERKPRRTFEAPGSYDVILEVSDNQNTIDRITKTIIVQ